MAVLAGTQNHSGGRVKNTAHKELIETSPITRIQTREHPVLCPLVSENVPFDKSTRRIALEMWKFDKGKMQFLHGVSRQSKTHRDCVSMFLCRIAVYLHYFSSM